MPRKTEAGIARSGERVLESWELPHSPFNPDNIEKREQHMREVVELVTQPRGLATITQPESYGLKRWVFIVRQGCLHWVTDPSSGTCRFKCEEES